MHDLSEREANKVVSHLSVARLQAKKVLQPDGRWAISVAQAEMVPALNHLDTQRVLASRDTPALAAKGSMIPSREEQWFRYERSVATSIEESLAAIPGVLEGRVHITIPEQDPLFSTPGRHGGSGSVLLVVDELFSASDDQVSSLVAGAAGIPREAVRILKSAAPPVRADTAAQATGGTALVRTSDGVSSSALSESPPTSFVDESGWMRRAMALIPWVEVASVCSLLCAGVGVQRLRALKRKRVTFPIPKELDFEG